MCFNATINTPLEVAQTIYNLKVSKVLKFNNYGKHNIAFTNPLIPIIKSHRELDLGKWGLIPHWVNNCDKADEISKYTLNARIETITDKPSFKYSVERGRVIIMFDGFYEWKHVGKSKIPYYISSEKPLLLGGIASKWSGVDTFSIITTQAEGIMKEVHNSKERMPYFLDSKDIDSWLDSNNKFEEVIKSIKPQYEHLSAIEQSP